MKRSYTKPTIERSAVTLQAVTSVIPLSMKP